MDHEKIDVLLKRRGAYIDDDHLVLTSGRHSRHYFNKNVLLPHYGDIQVLGQELGREFETKRVEVIVSVATAGIPLGMMVGKHLNVPSVFAEKHEGNFILGRGFDKLVDGKQALIVEDVFTTGDSVAKVIALVKQHTDRLVGAGALCNRGRLTAEQLGVHNVISLIDVDMPTWKASECPMCNDGTPVNTEIGHGRTFVAAQQA